MTTDKLSSRKGNEVGHPVLPGGLSKFDHDRIHALADRKWSSVRIARDISKHPSTVYWYMCTAGLVAPKQTDAPLVFTRGDRTIRRFSRDEDAFITALRVEGLTPTEIARRIPGQFGHERPAHSVTCRLRMLASIDQFDVRRQHERFR